MPELKRLPDSSPKARSIVQVWKNRARYKFNRDYQRASGAWTKEDQLYLIDSILRNADLPKFYVRKMPNDIYEVVDGQQRLLTIWRFIEDKNFQLTAEISGHNLAGKTYETLPEELRDHFEGYDLDLVILNDYDDEMVRELFSRLQRGRPLTPAERLNAFPGSIVPVMRSIAHHGFFSKFTFGLKRYRDYLIAARMLMLTKEGVCDIGPRSLYDFFVENRAMDSNSKETKRVKHVLNYLNKVFPEKIAELSNDSWIINLYLLTRRLLRNYVMDGREDDLNNFYRDFWTEAEGLQREEIKHPKFRINQDFLLAMSSGTTGKDRVATRLRIMMEDFIESHSDLELLDPKREFNRYEKAVIYRRDKGKCQWSECGKHVPWSEYEADHIYPWSKGGPTTLKNGQVLCKTHNRKKSDSK